VEDFAPSGVAAFLARAVEARRNVVVVGGTGSGKTTLLNALGGCIPAGERIVTVEDTAELALEHAHVVRLEARRPNSDGAGEVPIRRLVTNALRMRPDRIVVGEVRGAEVLDMAQAMNSGHEGSLSTCHANSPRDALRRLEAMALLAGSDVPLAFVRHQLVSAVHLLVQVRRLADGRRQVAEVVELLAGHGTERQSPADGPAFRLVADGKGLR
jgi:pilus assembly protein CpaF